LKAELFDTLKPSPHCISLGQLDEFTAFEVGLVLLSDIPSDIESPYTFQLESTVSQHFFHKTMFKIQNYINFFVIIGHCWKY
jgi:hypothetical protein